MRGVYGDPERFWKTYFSTYPGRYFTGDGAPSRPGSHREAVEFTLCRGRPPKT